MSLSELLVREAVILRMEAPTASEVIKILGNRLWQAGYVGDEFVEATLAREAVTPTGLPLGGQVNAALPHADIDYVRRSGVALATLNEPVIFYNMVTSSEEVPVQLVIMLALADPKSQIEMLQEVATILQQAEIVEALMAADSIEEVLSIVQKLGARS